MIVTVIGTTKRVHRRCDRLRPLHRGEHRDRRRDHAVAEEQGRAEHPEAREQELRPPRDPVADLADLGDQRHDPALPVVVGAHHQADVLDGDDHRHRPEDQRDHPVDCSERRLDRMRVARVEGRLDRVDRAGPDVAEDDAERRHGQGRPAERAFWVGLQGRASLAALAQNQLGDAQVERGRHLDVLRARPSGSGPGRPGARRASRRRWPPAASRDRRAPRAARRRGTPAESGPPRGRSGRASAPPGRRRRACLIVSVTGAAAITPAASASRGELARPPRRSAPAVTSGRAASWTTTISSPQSSSAFATDSERCSPPATATTPRSATEPSCARRRRDDDLADARSAAERVERPVEHRPPGELDEGLRAAGSESLPGAGGRDHGRCGGARRSPWRRRSSPPAARRDSPRRRPRPCRART